MGTFVLAVPVLLVVVLGYAVSYTLWEATGLGGNPEIADWLTGLALWFPRDRGGFLMPRLG